MNNLTFGVEIEYRDLSRVKVTKFIQEYFPDWKSEKEDAIIKSSTNPKLGGEIISPILTNNEKTWHDITTICKYLVDNQASSLNTGAHIHIGSSIFQNDPQIFFRFIKLWCAYEHIIYRFSHGEYCYARDSLFTYAPPVSKELKFLMRTLKLTESSSFSYLITVLNLGKKRGLNLNNINRDSIKNTIEFRCPNGTFNPNIWYNNFLLFKRMIEYARKKEFNEQLIDERLKKEVDITDNKIVVEDAIEFANLIYLDEKEKLQFLQQYLKGKEETKEYKLSRKQKC